VPGDVEALHQLTREILGLWQGTLPGIPAWYVEGSTDYLAWLVLMRESLVPRGTFRQQLLVAERLYRAHPMAAEWSFTQEEARFGNPLNLLQDLPVSAHDPASLARSRGVIVTLVLDALLARETDGERRLVDLAGVVYRRTAGQAEHLVGTAALMAACAELTGGNYLDDFFRDLVFMPGSPLVVQALTDIMGRESGHDP
jgi:predicted metalloprotease with PDZ domain